MTTLYAKGGIAIKDPTPEDVVKYLQALDGENNSEFGMDEASYSLNVVGTVDNRVRVEFLHYETGHGSFAKFLNNGTPHNQKYLYVTLSNGEDDMIYLHETVSLEDAIKVCTYFAEHGVPPDPLPDGLRWV